MRTRRAGDGLRWQDAGTGAISVATGVGALHCGYPGQCVWAWHGPKFSPTVADRAWTRKALRRKGGRRLASRPSTCPALNLPDAPWTSRPSPALIQLCLQS